MVPPPPLVRDLQRRRAVDCQSGASHAVDRFGVSAEVAPRRLLRRGLDDVFNMASQSGGISEAFEAGVTPERIQKIATRSDLRTTVWYNRGDQLCARLRFSLAAPCSAACSPVAQP